MRMLAAIGLVTFGIPVSTGLYVTQDQLLDSEPKTAQKEVEALAQAPLPKKRPVYISKNDCRFLTAHQPDASVAYTPGQDAYGRAVVPADLENDYDYALPEQLVFRIRKDVSPDPETEIITDIWQVTVDVETGQVRLNGQPISSSRRAALVAWCKDNG